MFFPSFKVIYAELSLQVNRSNSGSASVQLHRVTSSWTEGSDVAAGNGGAGVNASSGATWLYRDFPNTQWAAAGGDFSSSFSAQAQAGDAGTEVLFTDLQNDVQDMVTRPSANFGWLLKHTSETTAGSAKR